MGKPDRVLFKTALIALGDWFERRKRILPWRDEPTLYRVWVSEIMLQQTQVITVIPYFEKFLARFPTVESLAKASEEEVTASWAGLGYYSRARNLRKGAKLIVESADFPRTREAWLEIPGVGPYTAGAILSTALGQCEAILDGNVERVMSRVRRVDRARGDTAFKQRLWKLSKIFVSRGNILGVSPSALNQSLMELGAMICTPKKPRCLMCPLRGICRAQQAGVQESYPPRKKPKEWIKREESLHCVIDFEGRVLLRKRESGEWRAGLWDLVEEKPALGFEAVGVIETRHVVTRHKITRRTQIWKMSGPLFQAAENVLDVSNNRFVSFEEFETLGTGSALMKTIKEAGARFPGLFTG